MRDTQTAREAKYDPASRVILGPVSCAGCHQPVIYARNKADVGAAWRDPSTGKRHRCGS